MFINIEICDKNNLLDTGTIFDLTQEQVNEIINKLKTKYGLKIDET